MLKLKYLFDNSDLAEMILGNWEFDQESIDLFKYYRVSSNAIYPFQAQGKTQFLRFSPKAEKYRENILAELDFISYLRSEQYGVLEIVVSKNGEELVEVQTPWGEYFASVFKRVAGVQLNKTDLNDIIIFNHGKALGKLHQLSSEYKPINNKRWSYSDVLNWIHNILIDIPNETLALMETKLLQDYFDSIPITKNNFGLIHYDFEFDNVFFDEESQSCNVIDFDDAMYHWFVMDIEQALDSLQDCISAEMFQQKKQCFMDGYRTEYELSDDMMSLLPACRRFANLYGYVRILRSVEKRWENEPEWLVSLREKLIKAMKNKSSSFGMEI
ncbi:phosphotransferase enzyme family protein [Viridibacillus arvi]|uniref:phosphotransferase enzyme family protein n=1 Tax=Viridibacillus arvi TaxID=263475 RepID=UPI00187B71C7|nr:phosphotransferase [Viridibacillus sp. JNUCC-6]QOV11448.1 phosphotransferase [Viridibacillus sp. JNUCC-6]